MDCSQLGYKSGEMTLVGSNLILVKVKSLMQDLNQQLSIRRNEPGEFTTSAFPQADSGLCESVPTHLNTSCRHWEMRIVSP